MMRKYQYILIVICGVAIAACNQNQQTQTPSVIAPTAKAELMAPFRYHKMIESSPGKYFDVFGWGRGKDSSGSYMILQSDSLGKQYSNTSGDLEGSIIDVFNTDMNMDGNPEVLIEAKAKDTTNHINIYAYEFRGSKSTKLNFPKLTDKTKKTYRGDDKLYIKDGNLVREFPTYDGVVATGQKKILQYALRDGEFSVKDISPADTTSAKATVKDTVSKSAAKADKPKESGKKSSKKEKKHHKEESHPKKKKHRHRD